MWSLDGTDVLRIQASVQPAQAVAILNDRIKHVGKLNTEIADWLQVYAIVVLSGQTRVLTGVGTPQDRRSLCDWPAKACAQVST